MVLAGVAIILYENQCVHQRDVLATRDLWADRGVECVHQRLQQKRKHNCSTVLQASRTTSYSQP